MTTTVDDSTSPSPYPSQYPPVVHISSELAPVRIRRWSPSASDLQPAEGASVPHSSSSSRRDPQQPRPRHAEVDDELSAYEEWKEWYINPTGHGLPVPLLHFTSDSIATTDPGALRPLPLGPSRYSRPPPKFVRSQGTYDELGRSIGDGVGVDVDQPRAKVGDRDDEDGKGRGKKRATGPEVAEWYASLRSSRPAETPPIPPKNEVAESKEVEVIVINSDSDDYPPETSKPSLVAEDKKTALNPPLRVHSRDWFIRRALLAQSRSTSSSPGPSTAVSTLQRAPRPPPASSISGLLSLPSSPRPMKRMQPRYALGPDNRGYELLRDLGWDGGGLGRPEGWVEAERAGGAEGVRDGDAERVKIEFEERMETARRIQEVVDELGNDIVDMTNDSSDEEGVATAAADPAAGGDGTASPLGFMDDTDDIGDAGLGASGPGRTAPLATLLKLDRFGLGHRRGPLTPKVTHSADEIDRARQRAKGVVSKRKKNGARAGETKEEEERRKVGLKWKEREKRDRAERMKIARAVNS